MNFTKEQKRYIKRRLRELKPKKLNKWIGVWFAGCLLIGCASVFPIDAGINIYPIKKVESVIQEQIIDIATLTTKTTSKVVQSAEVLKPWNLPTKPSNNPSAREIIFAKFGCVPDKPEEPKMTDVKPKLEEPKQLIKPVKAKAKAKAVIYGVKKQGNTFVVKVNKSAMKDKNTRVRVFIGYCYYEGGEIDKDGNVKVLVEWYPPNQTKIGVSVFQLTNHPEIGSGHTLGSVVVPFP
ncbi:hypothetical protein A2Z67_05265 [Candidatus Woesebacteria bacterium RBG_13_36_22]|uniref:Uncharacterized protein n=1 Tax=Candidatus Woesebacteria bacterium RBG_13_36_22 TaxID=1802478 RepID=A0A1F7X2L3_9BACT|nr:MAG: hypothetical protein A2Z67_05265 [Candidatus Woesebacteria bacterium RBG_13_36_22]